MKHRFSLLASALQDKIPLMLT